MVITLENSSNNNVIAHELGVPHSISDIVDINSEFILKGEGTFCWSLSSSLVYCDLMKYDYDVNNS